MADGEHAAAIAGLDLEKLEREAGAGAAAGGEFSEAAAWEALKGCFDPEIPVNIVDLGLVYDLDVEELAKGEHKVEVKMTLTAPGCGMGPVIAEDARQRVAALPGVKEAKVHIVWDPQWTPQMIWPAASSSASSSPGGFGRPFECASRSSPRLTRPRSTASP